MQEAKESVLNLAKHWQEAATPQKMELQRALFPNGLMVSEERGYFEHGNTSLFAAIREFFDELDQPHKNGRDGQI